MTNKKDAAIQHALRLQRPHGAILALIGYHAVQIKNGKVSGEAGAAAIDALLNALDCLAVPKPHVQAQIRASLLAAVRPIDKICCPHIQRVCCRIEAMPEEWVNKLANIDLLAFREGIDRLESPYLSSPTFTTQIAES